MPKKTILTILNRPFYHKTLVTKILPEHFEVEIVQSLNDAIKKLDSKKYDRIYLCMSYINLYTEEKDQLNETIIRDFQKDLPFSGGYIFTNNIRQKDKLNYKTPVTFEITLRETIERVKKLDLIEGDNYLQVPEGIYKTLKALGIESSQYFELE